MAYPDDVDVADDPLLPKSVPIEKATGQARGGITGLNSVVPFRAAGWSDQYPDGTQKTSLWNPDAPTPSIERLKNKIGSLWNGGSQGIMDSIQRGADKALAAVPGDTGGAAAPLGITDPESPVGGEAAPLGVTSPPAGRALEKFADVLDTKNPPTKAPEGSLLDKITGQPRDLDSGPTPPSAISPGTDRTAAGSDSAELPPKAELTQQQGPRAGLFGVPGLLGEFGANVHNWTDQRRMQLLALAGGLAGAPSLGQGFGRGFTAAAGAIPQQQALNAQNATIDYFKKSGMDQSTAMAFAGNKALAQEALGQMTGMAPPKTMQWKDWLGGQHQLQWDWKNKTWKDLDTATGGSGSDTGNAESTGPGAGVPGGLTRAVSQAEWQAMPVSDRIDLIKDPTMRNLVKSLSVGGNIPGRQQMTAANAVMAAIDPNWNQAYSYNAEKQMAEGLNKNTVTQHGGALLRIMSTFEHMKDAAHASAEVGGWSGYNGPGGGRAGNAYMGVRNFAGDPRLQSALSEERKQWNNASTESTAYYAGAPGSEGERTAGLRDVVQTATPMEKAGTLRGQAEQLDAKFRLHLAQVMGTHAGQQYFKDRPYLMQQFERNRHDLDVHIARLDPTGPEATRLRTQGQLPQTQTPPQTQGTEGTGGKPPVVFQGGHEFHLQPDGNYHYWRSQ